MHYNRNKMLSQGHPNTIPINEKVRLQHGIQDKLESFACSDCKRLTPEPLECKVCKRIYCRSFVLSRINRRESACPYCKAEPDSSKGEKTGLQLLTDQSTKITLMNKSIQIACPIKGCQNGNYFLRLTNYKEHLDSHEAPQQQMGQSQQQAKKQSKKDRQKRYLDAHKENEKLQQAKQELKSAEEYNRQNPVIQEANSVLKRFRILISIALVVALVMLYQTIIQKKQNLGEIQHGGQEQLPIDDNYSPPLDKFKNELNELNLALIGQEIYSRFENISLSIIGHEESLSRNISTYKIRILLYNLKAIAIQNLSSYPLITSYTEYLKIVKYNEELNQAKRLINQFVNKEFDEVRNELFAIIEKAQSKKNLNLSDDLQLLNETIEQYISLEEQIKSSQ
ncbi:hypothetical protein FGO68_gene15568 [Halteria grandinella]|uniref:RING-type domain-containing protein n=1 Tax=Halteria grandinella TaxID=5974 RepID=A0A8J8T7R3_HALGN|nr:hypothetical protein FGO68_gene15568 [Halteria grandinella]